jgi:ADP-heptose:LPS heptosyltransferase
MDLKIPKKTSPPLSILIILMGALGDVARGLCLVNHIKRHLPACRITWLVEPKSLELVALHDRIDKIIVFHRAWRYGPVRQLRKELSRMHFDITLDLQRHLKSGYFSYLSGAKRRIGFHRRNAKEFNWLFSNEKIDYYSDDLPKLDHYLKFTEYLGIPAPEEYDFGFSSVKLDQIAPDLSARIRLKSSIGIILGSSWKSKDWYLDGYLQLIDNLIASKNKQLILLGDQSQRNMASILSQTIDSPDLINMTGKTSLKELIGILEAVEAAVGPDSGPGHLAAAVGTPYVSLFGPTSPKRVAPFGCEHLVVAAATDCRPCYKKRCPKPDHPCMIQIKIEDIEEKLTQALSKGKIDTGR